jgi:hypothetical protein
VQKLCAFFARYVELLLHFQVQEWVEKNRPRLLLS